MSKNTAPITLAINTNNTYISNSGGILCEVKKPTYLKNQFSISSFDLKNAISSSISISKNMPEEDLYDAITTKAYDELGLDQAIEYRIEYIETYTKIDDENRNFFLFIVEPLVIQESYKAVVEQIKYIDVIIPSPLLLKSLYTEKIIEDTGVHCFIYIQENDAFIAIYCETRFVYAKSLKYSFVQMHEQFCELFGEKIEYSIFIDFLQNHSLKESQNKYKEYFLKLYRDIFLDIGDILTYVKRAYDLEKIEHIYIGSEVDTVTKLDEIIEYQLNVKASNFEFNYGLEKSEIYIDDMLSLMHLYANTDDDEKYLCNFTIFYPPPRFTKRQSGKVILLILASIVAAFIYPVTYWILTYAGLLQYQLLDNKYKEIHNIKTVREIAIRNKQIEKQKILKLLNIEKQKYKNKKNTLIKIHNVKVNYPMKAKILTILTQSLNKFHINLNHLYYDELEGIKTFHLNLISRRDKQITSLIQYLTKKYFGIYDFSIQEIHFDEQNNRYISELKVVIL